MSTQKSSQFQLESEKNRFGQEVGMRVAVTEERPFKTEDLRGRTVKLINIAQGQITASQIEQLWSTVCSEPNEQCWTYLPYDGFASKQDLADALKSQFGFAGSIHYLIEVDSNIVGWVALLNIRPNHRVLEIGNVYFSHSMKQSTAATETIYLLLKESIQQNFRRIEWKCDDFNQPSKQAALRFGFQHEGVFRQDRINKGRNRNTAWFSIVDQEWLQLNLAYEAWLNVDNFDQHGRQKIRLQDFMVLYG
ncbi:GNAT family N-acetyltransferase [Acinetobacter sp. 194]|uniref:GNAT family N-acetyltransferase n=1 Tax=Acinetobacter shaoyimingii TaxID=2715164 RepID=UPI00140E64BB|nr:GNAT family protein [Acinetobacter shaoyimingii]NHB57539.1 GNAT family N-acetyltransferase [Acinetobacter shaoyimingii]